MHLLSAGSINLFLATNMEFYAQGWIFFFRKSKPVVLPDVVATLSSDENILESQEGPSQDNKIILEKLEEENLRLKAIFKLHSIKIQEDAGGVGGGDGGGDQQLRRRGSSGSVRVSSISSESSSASAQSCKVGIL